MKGSDTPRAWQRMLSGRRLDLLSPQPEDIEIEDIAHGLARVARWNGQTKGEYAFSVAQHSLIVTDILADIQPGFGPQQLCAGLLHDAAEYVIGDLISPFKAAIGLDYKAFENRLLKAIHCRFALDNVDAAVAAEIKHADRIAAYYEATRLAGFEEEEAERFFGRPALTKALSRELAALKPVSPGEAESQFLSRFGRLSQR